MPPLSFSLTRYFTLRKAIALCLALAGTWFMGEGLWIKAKAVLAQHLLERAFADTVATGQPVKPWGWADTWPVARVEVPRLGASAIVLHGGSGQAMAFGPGHLATTPEPGEAGTVVFAAHRDTHFAFLGGMKTGDRIKVTRRDGLTFTYRVTGSEVVRFDKSGIDAKAPGRHLALATCWPLDGSWRGPLRYVVHAELETGLALTSPKG
jgi:sortase A